jgi:hypothetical protein
MRKFKSNPKLKYQEFLILELDIDLTLACLRVDRDFDIRN